MIRIIVLSLLAANLLYFGWSSWVDDEDPALTAVEDAPAAKPAPAVAAPVVPVGPPPCSSVGPFTSDLDALSAEQKLTAAGWGLLRRAISEHQLEGYWVYVSSNSAAAQNRTLNTILASGIRDAFAMPDDPEFRVSVGIFSEENRAEDRAARVQRLRLDAVVRQRMRDQTVFWFDIPGVARETLADGRLAATGLPLERLRIEACPDPAAEAPAEGAPAEPPSQEAAPNGV